MPPYAVAAIADCAQCVSRFRRSVCYVPPPRLSGRSHKKVVTDTLTLSLTLNLTLSLTLTRTPILILTLSKPLTVTQIQIACRRRRRLWRTCWRHGRTS